MAAAICEISNCHCTQLNYCLFTNHSPLVSWQQYLTTIADFSLNSTVIHSPTTPLWYHGSNTQPPIANFSLNSTVIHSPTTPLWYHGSNTQPPLLISHSTQLSSIHQPLPYHGSNTQPPIANFSLNSTVIHSPTTPLWYHGSNTPSPLLIPHSTQLPTHSILVIWQQFTQPPLLISHYLYSAL